MGKLEAIWEILRHFLKSLGESPNPGLLIKELAAGLHGEDWSVDFDSVNILSLFTQPEGALTLQPSQSGNQLTTTNRIIC